MPLINHQIRTGRGAVARGFGGASPVRFSASWAPLGGNHGEGLAAARDPSSFLKGMVHFQKFWRYLTIHERICWMLQTLGWLLMLMLLVAMSVVGRGEEKLLQFVVFRNALGFLLTAFLRRPILRWWRRRHAAAPLRQVPILIGLIALFGFADARISFYVFNLFSNVQATAGRSRLYFESTNTLRSGLYAIWVSLYAGINYFIPKSGVDYRMRWPRKGATQMAPFQGSVSLGCMTQGVALPRAPSRGGDANRQAA